MSKWMMMVCFVVIMFAFAPLDPQAPLTDQSIVETGITPPPDGRPPTGALQRTDSRKWEITLSIDLPAFHKDDAVSESIIVPVSILDTWWRVDPRSFRAKVSVDLFPVADVSANLTVNQSRSGDSRVEISIPNFVEFRLRTELTWVVEIWSCQLDETAAAKEQMPAAWPEEVQRWRLASPRIDPQDPQIQELRRQILQRISADTPPIYAAKEIIRTGSRSLKSGNHKEGNPFGIWSRGLEMRGSSQALATEIGSESDVACICVALLRSMGFPARPVIGLVDRSKRSANSLSNKKLGMWGEVYLPNCGWVPFDSDWIRGGISAANRLDQPWNGFGSDSEFNERVPITHELDIYQTKAADGNRVASFLALCRLKTKLDQPGQGPTDILVQTALISRGRGQR